MLNVRGAGLILRAVARSLHKLGCASHINLQSGSTTGRTVDGDGATGGNYPVGDAVESAIGQHFCATGAVIFDAPTGMVCQRRFHATARSPGLPMPAIAWLAALVRPSAIEK